MSGAYDDILHLPHPTSARHPRMPMANRAAQFSPFAALTGYEDAIRETARLTDTWVEPDEELQQLLTDRLHRLTELLPQQPLVQAVWFRPDERKTGGAYCTTEGRIQKIDLYARLLVFADGTRVPLDALTALEGNCFFAAELL